MNQVKVETQGQGILPGGYLLNQMKRSYSFQSLVWYC